jgi:chaperone required for assembly of F1-ATPase
VTEVPPLAVFQLVAALVTALSEPSLAVIRPVAVSEAALSALLSLEMALDYALVWALVELLESRWAVETWGHRSAQTSHPWARESGQQ